MILRAAALPDLTVLRYWNTQHHVIAATDSGDWLVRYAEVELGYIHPQRRRLSPRPIRGANRPGDLREIAAAIPTTPRAHQPQHP